MLWNNEIFRDFQNVPTPFSLYFGIIIGSITSSLFEEYASSPPWNHAYQTNESGDIEPTIITHSLPGGNEVIILMTVESYLHYLVLCCPSIT